MSFSIFETVKPDHRSEYLQEEFELAAMWNQHPSVPAGVITTICIRGNMTRKAAAELLLANSVIAPPTKPDG